MLENCILLDASEVETICNMLCSQLQERYHLSNNRSVPDWGKEIFSHLCVIMRPTTTEELGNFIKYTIALTQAYLQLSVQTSKIPSNK